MLYVSRRRGSRINMMKLRDDEEVPLDAGCGCYIVDTDDGVEEYISCADLREVLSDGMIEVKGAWVDDCDQIYIRPYQPPETCTPLQTKLLMMHGVSVSIYKNRITNISYDSDEMKREVRIRLSDLATKLDECVLCDESSIGVEVTHNLVLVFDDKLEDILPNSLADGNDGAFDYVLEPNGVVFDISEMRNEELVTKIYKQVHEFSMEGIDIAIDRQDRLDRLYGKEDD